jgi:uncharacterized protein with GYD domain
MAKFAIFFSYKAETWQRMLDKPSDRRAAVGALAESGGGKLESMYFMFGDRDGFVVVDVPDAESAAAIALAATSTGDFSRLETHELIDPQDLPRTLRKASEVRGRYTRPGT